MRSIGITTFYFLSFYQLGIYYLSFNKSIGEFKDKSIDTFFLFHSFEHLPDPLKVLQEIKSKLRNKGKLIIKQSGLLVNFFGGFIGSVIGTLTILFLYINEYLPLDLLKLK